MEASKEPSTPTEDNPFLALFKPLPTTNLANKPPTPPPRDLSDEHSNRVLQKLNKVIEDIFAFTTNAFGFLGRAADDPVKKSGLVIIIKHKCGSVLLNLCMHHPS